MRAPVLAGLVALLPTACLLSLGLAAPVLASPTLSEESCCQFDVYLQQGASEYPPFVNGAGVDGPYGAFVRSVCFGVSGMIYHNPTNGLTRFLADDVMVGPGDGDITADITFSGGVPIRIVPVRGNGAATQSVIGRYIFDFKMNGQVIVSRWQLHYGETFDLPWIGPLFSATAAAPRVNTPTPTATKANVDFTLTHVHSVGGESATFDFGNGIPTALAVPLPATVSHEFTLGAPSVKSRTFTAIASMTSPVGGAGSQITVTVLRQPDVALRIDGQTVLDGATVEVEPGRLLQLSLADSLGYIEQGSFSIGGKLDQAGAGLSYSGILFGDSDLGQTYALTVGVTNTGAGINADSMTVNLSVVPEPATLGLLGLAACGLLGRRRRKG